jgi:hypothetical protein
MCEVWSITYHLMAYNVKTIFSTLQICMVIECVRFMASYRSLYINMLLSSATVRNLLCLPFASIRIHPGFFWCGTCIPVLFCLFVCIRPVSCVPNVDSDYRYHWYLQTLVSRHLFTTVVWVSFVSKGRKMHFFNECSK